MDGQVNAAVLAKEDRERGRIAGLGQTTKSGGAVTTELHRDVDDGVAVAAVPDVVLLSKAVRERNFLFSGRGRGVLVAVQFVHAVVDGDVELLAIVLAGALVVAVGPVALQVKLERTAEFTVHGHHQALVEFRVHAEAEVDVDEAVVDVLLEHAVLSRGGVVGVKVGPGVVDAVVPEVERGRVGRGLTRVFLLRLLRADVTGLHRNEHHGGHNHGQEEASSHGRPSLPCDLSMTTVLIRSGGSRGVPLVHPRCGGAARR